MVVFWNKEHGINFTRKDNFIPKGSHVSLCFFDTQVNMHVHGEKIYGRITVKKNNS